MGWRTGVGEGASVSAVLAGPGIGFIRNMQVLWSCQAVLGSIAGPGQVFAVSDWFQRL